MTSYKTYFQPLTIPGISIPAPTSAIVNPTAPYKTNVIPVSSPGSSPIILTGSSGSSKPSGIKNVVDVFKNIVTLKPIYANTGNPTTDVIVGATSQAAGTAALGFGLLGLGAAGIDYVAGSAATASAGKLTSSIAGKGLPSWLLPAAAGAGAGYLLFNKAPQTQQTTPTQNTNPSQTPTQNTNPSQPTNQNPQTNPTVYVPGSNNVVYQDTYAYSQSSSSPTQNTFSYQISNQTTTTTQSTTAAQTGSFDWLPIALIAGAFLLLNNQGG